MTLADQNAKDNGDEQGDRSGDFERVVNDETMGVDKSHKHHGPDQSPHRDGEVIHASMPSNEATAKVRTPNSLCDHSRSNPTSSPTAIARAILVATSTGRNGIAFTPPHPPRPLAAAAFDCRYSTGAAAGLSTSNAKLAA